MATCRHRSSAVITSISSLIFPIEILTEVGGGGAQIDSCRRWLGPSTTPAICRWGMRRARQACCTTGSSSPRGTPPTTLPCSGVTAAPHPRRRHHHRKATHECSSCGLAAHHGRERVAAHHGGKREWLLIMGGREILRVGRACRSVGPQGRVARLAVAPDETCHSVAAPPSPCIRCFNRDGEGMSAK